MRWEQHAEASEAAHNEELAARNEALMIFRALQVPDPTKPVNLRSWARLQHWASASTVNALRTSEQANAEQLAVLVATLTAKDWREYAGYAEFRATVFAYADSASVASTADRVQRYETLRSGAVSQAAAVEDETPEMGWMYAAEFATELERGRCSTHRDGR